MDPIPNSSYNQDSYANMKMTFNSCVSKGKSNGVFEASCINMNRDAESISETVIPHLLSNAVMLRRYRREGVPEGKMLMQSL